MTAPQAVQLADRWHLLKHVGAARERVLQGLPTALRAAAQAELTPAAAAAPPEQIVAAAPTSSEPQAAAVSAEPGRGDQRLAARSQQLLALAATGLSIPAMQRASGLSRATIRTYLRAAACPLRAARAGLLAPGSRWEQRLRAHWDAGCQNAATRWTDVRTAGFPGSAGLVRRHVGNWRAVRGRRGRSPTGASATASAAPAPVPSPRQVHWWLLGAPEELTDDQRAYLRRLLAAVPLLATAQRLALELGHMVRARDLAALAGWLRQAEASGVAALPGVAVGMRRDRAASAAALLLPWSQGQTEGQVTRLTLVKRALYGRGGLDLLLGRLRRGA